MASSSQTSEVQLNLNGPLSQAASLAVAGHCNLSGTLLLDVDSGSISRSGGSVTVLTCMGERSGEFKDVQLMDHCSNSVKHVNEVTYSNIEVLVRLEPEDCSSGSWPLEAASALWIFLLFNSSFLGGTH